MGSKEPVHVTQIDSTQVLAGLKDFQRRTVDYVIKRFYEDDPPARRLLVADEVGLGKTMVARGVVARAAEILDRQADERIDIIYICSNADIARQNLRRLHLPGFEPASFSTRPTLLPLYSKGLMQHRINFVSFTPGTAFEVSRSLGRVEERVLVYDLLKRKWPDLVGNKKGPMRVFQGYVSSLDGFAWEYKKWRDRLREADPVLVKAFHESIDAHDREARRLGVPTLRERYEELAYRWRYEPKDRDAYRERERFVGDLRALLARACIGALKPDLVILDEFQRFRHLLTEDSEEAELAHALFDYTDEHSSSRVLLLSATPYKMYTVRGDTEDDHYGDFLRTTDFLMEGRGDVFRSDLKRLGRELARLDPNDLDPLVEVKERVETALRKVMCRTERLAQTEDRSGMLNEVPPNGVTLEADDLHRFVALDKAAAELGAGPPIEYWKSAPYFPNFWSGYEHFRRYQDADPETRLRVREALQTARALMPWEEWRRYRRIDPGNARLRALAADMIESEAWKLLWLPPALPYYESGGPFGSAFAQGLTKRLVFSSWNVVPRAVSTILSYEAERRMVGIGPRKGMDNTREARERLAEPLPFPKSSPTGMSSLAFVYPSLALAELGDPLQLPGIEGGRRSLSEVLDEIGRRIMSELSQAVETVAISESGAPDREWYWLAPLLLDEKHRPSWLFGPDPSFAWTWEAPGTGRSRGEGFERHLQRARESLERYEAGTLEMGPFPEDLARVLSLLAVGGPGTVALRALNRLARSDSPTELRDATWEGAARIAWGFRSLFNTPEIAQLVRGLPGKGPYWRRALEYCAEGNLQAVLDEYLFVLRDFEGLVGQIDESGIERLTETIASVVSIRAVDLRATDLTTDEPVRMRVRFALPFGTAQSDELGHLQRAQDVRAAFNSPFWPFVLTTTSIGQEGLDFHLYCHAVVHWNLPGNPVDMEQREGRVHRFMGHAVRKNLAHEYGSMLQPADDHPWDTLLEAALTPDRESDLVPYWIFPGPHRIERHVPHLPLSREHSLLPDLKRSLALYRLVFGQARQEELVEMLKGLQGDPDTLNDVVRSLTIDLSPPTPGSPAEK